MKCDAVFLTPPPRLSTAQCPVITLLVEGWHQRLPRPLLPDNGQRTPDKLVWVSRCSVHCTALNAGKTTAEQRGSRRRGRAGVGLSLRQLSASPHFSLGPLEASFNAASQRHVRKSIRRSTRTFYQDLPWNPAYSTKQTGNETINGNYDWAKLRFDVEMWFYRGGARGRDEDEN